jgi:hypothetical protein
LVLVWRVKLVAELRPGEVTETGVARIERDEQAGTADLGVRLTEKKQLMVALQNQIVPAQFALVDAVAPAFPAVAGWRARGVTR